MLLKVLKKLFSIYLVLTIPVTALMIWFDPTWLLFWYQIWFVFIFLFLFPIIIMVKSIRRYLAKKDQNYGQQQSSFHRQNQIFYIPYDFPHRLSSDHYLLKNNLSYSSTDSTSKPIYSKKRFMTSSERNFYDKIKCLESEYSLKIIPQINLATIVKKEANTNYYTDLFRNIDFAIFDREMRDVLLLIELNDRTHDSRKRKYRDKKIRFICEQCKIKLITFYTKYDNDQSYVLERIKHEIFSSIH